MKRSILALTILLSSVTYVNSKTPNKVGELATSIPNFSISTENACIGQQVLFTDISEGPAIKWLWQFDGTSPSTSQLQNPVVTYTASGVFSATLTVTFAEEGDLTVIKTDIIKVAPNPSATFSLSSPPCAGSPLNFINTGSLGTHSWLFDGGVPATSSAVNPSGISISPVGSHIVSHSVTSDGCVGVSTQTISVFDPIGGVSVATTSANCITGLGSFTIGTIGGGTSPFSFVVNGDLTGTATVYPNKAPGGYTINVTDAKGCPFTKTLTLNSLPKPTAVAVSVIATPCNQSLGKIQITGVTGGIQTYSFSVNGSAFTTNSVYPNLSANIHTVVVKDGNFCTFTTGVNVPNSQGPSNFTVAVANETCVAGGNGSINFTNVTGGTNPLSYSITGRNFQTSPIFTNLNAGVYVVTVKDNGGCTSSKNITLTTIAPTDVAITVTSTPCGVNNGKISLGTVTGGAFSYSFSLDGGNFTTATNYAGLAAGQHTIVVKDGNQCLFSKTTQILNTSGPTNFSISVASETCNLSNGSITISNIISGTPIFSYSLNGGPTQTTTSFGNLSSGNYVIGVTDQAGCVITKTTSVAKIAPTNISVSVTNAACNVNIGSILIESVSGGVPTFSFSMDGGAINTNTLFTGLVGGTHSVLVVDGNNCPFTKTITVGGPTKLGPLSLNVSVKKAGCTSPNDGSITILGVTGGTFPYSFKFNNSLLFTQLSTYIGLSAGNYTFVVKDLNSTCQLTTVVPVGTVAAGPNQINWDGNSSTCGSVNGALSFTVTSGGTSPFTYKLDGPIENARIQSSQNFNSLPSGDYTLTVTDANGCVFNPSGAFPVWSYRNQGNWVTFPWPPHYTSPTIAIPTEIEAILGDAFCGLINGSMINIRTKELSELLSNMSYTIKKLGVGGSTVIANSNANLLNIAPASYIITSSTSQQCQFSRKVLINNLSVAPTPTVNVMNNGAYLRSTSSIGNQWFLNGAPIAGATSQNFVQTSNGDYYVEVTAGNCQTVLSNTVTISNLGGRSSVINDKIGEVITSTNVELNLFPNPNQGHFTFEFISDRSENYRITTTNVLGEIMYSKELVYQTGTYVEEMDFSKLPKGIYIVEVKGIKNCISKKIVIY